MWNGRFFEQITLTALGLVTQLGHQTGDTCPNPTPLRDLMVFALSGVHRLVVRYCGCLGAPRKNIQLLHARLFPATITQPSMAFAFDILDFFHKLQDQNKCNPYDFYHAIIQCTDAAGLSPNIICSFHFTLQCPCLLFCSTAMKRSRWSFASGPTSRYSNEVELSTALMILSRCLTEAWRFCVQPARNQERILSISPRPSCTDNLSAFLRFCCCTHLSLLL